jgi:hypothetical protein
MDIAPALRLAKPSRNALSENKVSKSGAFFGSKKDAATYRVFTTKRHPITTFSPAETHLFKG